MKLCRIGEPGLERPAMISGNGRILDLSGMIDDIDGAWLASGGVAKLQGIDLAALPEVNPGTRFGVPVAGVGKIVCAGMNYRDHCLEAGVPIPEQPALFMKATSALSGPNDPVIQPTGSTQLDWEVELAAVIGRTARSVTTREALSYVAGYTILNDVSDRDFQFNHGGQWFKGKSADTFCPVGPFLVTSDEIADPQTLGLKLSVNGQVMQSGNTASMIFGLAELIAHVSGYMTLEPGDILSTGTPPGVGMGHKPEPRWLVPGDVMRLEIEGLGAQEQRVVS
jgi:2,4-diketo-3-deoxy-L-fuconate hydrolase